MLRRLVASKARLYRSTSLNWLFVSQFMSSRLTLLCNFSGAIQDSYIVNNNRLIRKQIVAVHGGGS